MWDRFSTASEAEMPSDDDELLATLLAAVNLAAAEWGGTINLEGRAARARRRPAGHRHRAAPSSGFASEARVFLCNRPTQGGGLKRQLDTRRSHSWAGKTCFMLRASDFPPNKKNQTAQAFRKFRDAGGRSVLVPIPEWERMMTVREFHAHHRNDPGFAQWFEKPSCCRALISVIQLLRLDLLGRTLPSPLGDGRLRSRRPQ